MMRGMFRLRGAGKRAAAEPDQAARSTEASRVFAAAAAAAAAGDVESLRRQLWEHSTFLHEYLCGFQLDGAPAELTVNYVNDALWRFLHTLVLVPLPPPARMLEIGSNPYFFHVLLHKLFPGSEIEGANFFDHDIFSTRQSTIVQTIRHPGSGEVFEFSSLLFNLETTPVYPFPESSFDLVFFCETLEHLVVDPLATFRRLQRILRPGGHLLITLPNAVRLANFALMLHGHNFFDLYQSQNGVHGRHNREFTLAELETLLRHNGFEVVRAETHDRYDYDVDAIITVDYTGRREAVPEKRRDLVAILQRGGGSVEDRGDNLYLLARKPRQDG
jgi:SAM-dependent methyltransferase